MKEFKFSQIIRHIQDELIEAESKRKRNNIPSLFETDSCEVELKCILKTTENVGGKIGLAQLIAISSSQNISNDIIHTIKVRFKVSADNSKRYDNIEDIIERPRGKFPRTE